MTCSPGAFFSLGTFCLNLYGRINNKVAARFPKGSQGGAFHAYGELVHVSLTLNPSCTYRSTADFFTPSTFISALRKSRKDVCVSRGVCVHMALQVSVRLSVCQHVRGS